MGKKEAARYITYRYKFPVMDVITLDLKCSIKLKLKQNKNIVYEGRGSVMFIFRCPPRTSSAQRRGLRKVTGLWGLRADLSLRDGVWLEEVGHCGSDVEEYTSVPSSFLDSLCFLSSMSLCHAALPWRQTAME